MTWGRPRKIRQIITERHLYVRCPLQPGSLPVRVRVCMAGCAEYGGQKGNGILCRGKLRVMGIYCPVRGYVLVDLGTCRICGRYQGQATDMIMCEKTGRFAS